jgi:predicted Zn finger-like uncharacterized protein
VKFLCEQCKAKYQIADEKIVGKTVRMKCRKCGHLIEVRAEVTETSVNTERPSAPTVGQPTAAARPAVKPAPPRATALAASLTSARPAPPKQGALAGAFKTTVQHEEESSAPFDMSELSGNDDWYVAINGVPVGPVRVAEVRRKAALGAVTEDSLVWQEGLDEWRPLRSFPDLTAIVRTAALGGRTSITPPPPEARTNPPPAARLSSRPSPSYPSVQRPGAPRSAPLGPAPTRSNVVAISSRLATAEKLSEPAAFSEPAALPQPVGPGIEPTVGASSSIIPPPARKELPWIPILMVVCGLGFSVTLGLALAPKLSDLMHGPVTPAPTASSLSAAPVASSSSVAVAQPSAEAPATTAAPSPVKGPPVGGAVAKATTAPASTGRSLDLHGLGSNNVALADDPTGDGPKVAGQCLSEGQVRKVVQLHMVAVRRSCWERNQTANTKPSVNVNVTLTVGADGSSQAVSASGDDPSVAKCIENDVRGWHFPAMGCSQTTSIPFKFLLQ